MADDQRNPFVVWLLILIALGAVAIVPTIIVDRRLARMEERFARTSPAQATMPPMDLAEMPVLELARGQTVYVPAYGYVSHQGRRQWWLEVTLSVRNTDPRHGIEVVVADHYDTDGGRVRSYVDEPRVLAPLATGEFVIERREGGSGANFLVQWGSEEIVSEPVIEALMVGTIGSGGIAFVRSGHVIEQTAPHEPDA